MEKHSRNSALGGSTCARAVKFWLKQVVFVAILSNGVACSKQAPAPQPEDTLGKCRDCELPNVCIQGRCEPAGAPAVVTTFGAASGQVGLTLGNESATKAPMSFAVNANGLIVVLDQENGRLQAFRDGSPAFSLPLDSFTYSDVAFLGEDRVVLLDRQKRGSVVLMSLDGTVHTRTEVLGLGVEEAGLAGPLLVRPDGVWLEYRTQSIRYLNADGTPDPDRARVTDHLTADGNHEVAVLLGEHSVTVHRVNRTGLLNTRKAYREYPEVLWPEATLDSDARGKLYLQLQKRQPDGHYKRVLEVLDGALNWERSVDLPEPAEHGDADVFRSLVVSPKGEIFWMHWSGNQFQLLRY